MDKKCPSNNNRKDQWGMMAHVAHGLGVYASRLPRPKSELKAEQSPFLTPAQLFYFCFLSAK